MANVKRIYVEKKEDYAVAAKELKQEVKESLKRGKDMMFQVIIHFHLAVVLIHQFFHGIQQLKNLLLDKTLWFYQF